MKTYTQHKTEFCIGMVVTAVLIVIGIVIVGLGMVHLLRGTQEDVFSGIMLIIFGGIPLLIGVGMLFSFCCVYGCTTPPQSQDVIIANGNTSQVDKNMVV